MVFKTDAERRQEEKKHMSKGKRIGVLAAATVVAFGTIGAYAWYKQKTFDESVAARVEEARGLGKTQVLSAKGATPLADLAKLSIDYGLGIRSILILEGLRQQVQDSLGSEISMKVALALLARNFKKGDLGNSQARFKPPASSGYPGRDKVDSISVELGNAINQHVESARDSLFAAEVFGLPKGK